MQANALPSVSIGYIDIPLPRFERRRVGSYGYGHVGIFVGRLALYASTADWYHGYWPQTGMTYWRRRILVMGICVAEWKRWNPSITERSINLVTLLNGLSWGNHGSA
jgi:hypothetical protein